MSDPKTARRPTDQERQTLEAMTREAGGRVAMRAQMILLSARGYSAPDIAEIQDIAKVTVYKWILDLPRYGGRFLTLESTELRYAQNSSAVSRRI